MKSRLFFKFPRQSGAEKSENFAPSMVHEQMTKVPASKERVNVFDLHLALILTTLPVGLKI